MLKILLPFFPDNEYLRSKWWHRFVLVIAVLFSLISISLAVLLTVTSLKEFSEFTQIQRIGQDLELEELKEIRKEQLNIRTGETRWIPTGFSIGDLGKIVKGKYSQFSKYDDRLLGRAVLCKYPSYKDRINYYADCGYDWELPASLVLVFFLGAFGANIVYRVLLFIFTNNNWKKNIDKKLKKD